MAHARTHNSPSSTSIVSYCFNMDPAKVKESVRTATTELVSKSKVLDQSKEEELPHFDLPEIKNGKRLGAGAFGVVWEITGVTLSPDYKKKESSRSVAEEPKMEDDDEDDDAILDAEARSFISRTCQREETNEARYAIKILHAELANGLVREGMHRSGHGGSVSFQLCAS